MAGKASQLLLPTGFALDSLLVCGVGTLLIETFHRFNVRGLDRVEGTRWLHNRGRVGMLEADRVTQFVLGRVDDPLRGVAVVGIKQVAGI